ncbi:thioredoxin-like protein Clot [Phoenix dactylifera]|uniref:Thioredoxin-like protein Clot n=1 Tax=Phoenix dactylifera TaxID=42345 RepID=A0A8B7CBF4_PHODC|nr:thioredoxin-like protein Clot [Phoenix dactylifera]XP_008795747.1 thioredoxin-like protein Clot [Phoenix dactylifera]
MPLKTVDATVSDFEEVFERFKSENSQNQLKFLLFLANKDPSTSLSWCPDCNVAEPVIYEKLEASQSDVALLRGYVGDKGTWRNPSHPWRVDPRFKLSGVPTLIRWENEAIIGRLEDHEAHVGNKIDALLASN